MADLDPSTDPRDDEAGKYESTRPLSDAQLGDLGYLDNTKPEDLQAMTANTFEEKHPRDKVGEPRSFGEHAQAPVEGSGATADDVADEADPDEDSRLDAGLEETFPASDPVSAKHIT